MATTRRKFLSALLALPFVKPLAKVAGAMVPAGEGGSLLFKNGELIGELRAITPPPLGWMCSGWVDDSFVRGVRRTGPFTITGNWNPNPMTPAERLRENLRYERHFRPSSKMTDFLRRQA